MQIGLKCFLIILLRHGMGTALGVTEVSFCGRYCVSSIEEMNVSIMFVMMFLTVTLMCNPQGHIQTSFSCQRIGAGDYRLLLSTLILSPCGRASRINPLVCKYTKRAFK